MSERSGHTQQPKVKVTSKLCSMTGQPVEQADISVDKDITHASQHEPSLVICLLARKQGSQIRDILGTGQPGIILGFSLN